MDPYSGRCLYCHKGYALDANGLLCSKVIDYCKTYKTSYECKECEPNYSLFIDLNKPHFEVYCVPSTKVVNCLTTGNAIYLDPITKYETAINGCVVCNKAFTTDGSSCNPYTFVSADDCDIFNNWENKCVKCKPNYSLVSSGECVYKITNCVLASSANECILCVENYYWDSKLTTCTKNMINCIVQDSSDHCQICQ